MSEPHQSMPNLQSENAHAHIGMPVKGSTEYLPQTKHDPTKHEYKMQDVVLAHDAKDRSQLQAQNAAAHTGVLLHPKTGEASPESTVGTQQESSQNKEEMSETGGA